MKGNLMNKIKAIVTYLTSCGTLRSPKKEGGLGLFVYNPTNLDLAKLTALCEGTSMVVINEPTQTFYQGKAVPPHVWVGPEKAGVNTEDAIAKLSAEMSA
tara:strand:- start:145 stop:444 length:300 start_codon:yes stop_codon:yes gene_type:complete